VTAAYRELARRGLLVIRPGRPGGGRPAAVTATAASGEPPAGSVDLARYAPDRELLPAGEVFQWLGLGEGEGEGVAQYGSAWGYEPLRGWVARRLCGLGIPTSTEGVLLTGGVQHALDLLLRALARPGDVVLVEDPTYPWLPPLLALHQVRAVGVPVHRDGIHADDVERLLHQARPRLAIVTPTLHNPSGVVLDEGLRREVLRLLASRGTLVVEEFFDPALVSEGPVPPPLAALDSEVVGSFSGAVPGLRVGWSWVPAVVERSTMGSMDLGGSQFLGRRGPCAAGACWTAVRASGTLPPQPPGRDALSGAPTGVDGQTTRRVRWW
jgi:DNA-binding transcriptional MocR family regulator